MSLVKYRLKEVAADFGVQTKVIAEILTQYFEKPKSNTQVLTEDELNVVFDRMTAKRPATLEQVFTAAPTVKKEAPKEAPKQEAPKAEPKQEAKPQAQKPAQQPAKQEAPKPQKPAEPERKRERRVVDTSAVQVNTNRFADVDNLVSERVQNFQGGKQKFGGKKGQQQNKKDNKFKGN